MSVEKYSAKEKEEFQMKAKFVEKEEAKAKFLEAASNKMQKVGFDPLPKEAELATPPTEYEMD